MPGQDRERGVRPTWEGLREDSKRRRHLSWAWKNKWAFVGWGSLGNGILGIGKGICKGAQVGRGMKEALFLSCRGKTLGPCQGSGASKALNLRCEWHPLGLEDSIDLLFFSLSQAEAPQASGQALLCLSI